jgi:hypothetical protein
VTRPSLPFNAERSAETKQIVLKEIGAKWGNFSEQTAISGFAAAALDVAFVIVSTSKARINYPFYHSNDPKLHKIES